MRAPRLYVDLPLIPGGTLTLPVGPARHVIQALRAGPDARLLVFNGDGRDYAARVIGKERNVPTIAVESAGDEEPAPPLAVTLALGISKGERMDFAIQKSVELGVSALAPLFTERSMVQLEGGRLARRMEHWQGVIIAACEQSGRRRLPRLEPATTFGAWVAQARPAGLLLDPAAPHSLTALPPPRGEITLLVGPEGGLGPAERRMAASRGLRPVRLGPRVLRTETAPLAAIAVIQALWGDLRD